MVILSHRGYSTIDERHTVLRNERNQRALRRRDRENNRARRVGSKVTD